MLKTFAPIIYFLRELAHYAGNMENLVTLLFIAVVLSGFVWGDTITVKDPKQVHIYELPSGSYDLKNFRAEPHHLRSYGNEWNIKAPEDRYLEAAPNCSRAEIDAIIKWSSNDHYEQINRIMRTVEDGKVQGHLVSPKLEALVLMLSSAVNCAPQFEGQVVRAEKTPDWVLSDYQIGNDVRMRGFTATTKGKEIAAGIFPNWISKILIEVAVGADIDAMGIAVWTSEKEVLIRPSTTFRVRSREDHLSSQHKHWLFLFDQY